MTNLNLLFLGTEADKPYLPRLKPMMRGSNCFVLTKPISTFYEIESYCRDPKRNITGVVSTSLELLRKLTERQHVSIDNYAGSYFNRNGIEYVFVDPLEQLCTVSYGSFLTDRFISKLTAPQQWRASTKFNWCVLTPERYEEEYVRFSAPDCIAIACDIETFKENLAIRCVGYTAIFDFGISYSTRSIVIPLTDTWALSAVRNFNSLSAGKIFQNGKYDLSYLCRYNASPSNYLWDTATAFHCWYSELPKDLAFLQAFFVRNAAYWKDLAQTSDLEQYYLYNAKDTWATAEVFLAWISEAPEWAKKNYLQEFPLLFPCHLSEMTGVKRDVKKLNDARTHIDDAIKHRTAVLNRILGVDEFNVNSPKQMRSLLDLLGCKDIESADAKGLAKAAFRHPLNNHIIDIIAGVPKTPNIDEMGIRSLRKLKSTYLRTDEDRDRGKDNGAKELKGRILYALNPHGTDTGRLASKEHHFWCGLQIQNIPTGFVVKQTIVADDGFLFGESDLEQAETRDTAYLSGDSALISAVEGDRDFHSVNAAAFFGKPYDAIYDSVLKKTKDKPLRDLAKRVNHGANYLMGAKVLVETMGLKKIYEAARLLNLPKGWTAEEIAGHLLQAFERTYPTIRSSYVEWIVANIATTKKLVGPTGWTRYCFDDPRKSKPAKNAYVAHMAQSLNAMILNQAYLKVFYDIAINPTHSNNFKLCAQIHDSILFQYRKGHEYLCEMVRERMQIPITLKGADGKTRTFTVPAALKIGSPKHTAHYWSETE